MLVSYKNCFTCSPHHRFAHPCILDSAFRKPGTVQIYIGGTSIENQPCRLTVHFCIQIDVIENKLKVMLLGVEKCTKKQH